MSKGFSSNPQHQSEAAAMRDSMAKEGFNVKTLALMEDHPHMVHESYAVSFKIVDGLCNLINETLHEEPIGFDGPDLLTRLWRQLFLLKRLRRQLGLIGVRHKIMIEFREMLQACYKHDMNGILSNLEKVKIENENWANKMDAYFKLLDLDRPRGDKVWDSYLRELNQCWSKFLSKEEAESEEEESDSSAHSV